MLVCVQVLRNSGHVSDNEWDVFLHGGTLKLMSSKKLQKHPFFYIYMYLVSDDVTIYMTVFWVDNLVLSESSEFVPVLEEDIIGPTYKSTLAG